MDQLDALSTASDWIILVNHRFDERRAPSNQPRFENLSEEFQILWIELTEFWWCYVVTAELSVLKGPEIDWSWQRYFPSSYFDAFDSSLITKSFAKLMTYIRYDVNSDLLEQLKFISKNGLRKVRPFVKGVAVDLVNLSLFSSKIGSKLSRVCWFQKCSFYCSRAPLSRVTRVFSEYRLGVIIKDLKYKLYHKSHTNRISLEKCTR